MIGWDGLSALPDRLKDQGELLVYADGEEWRQEIDGGWVNLVDAEHAEESKQAITGGVKTLYTVDGLSPVTDTRYARRLSGNVWEANTFAPRAVGDCYTVRLTFRLETKSNASGQRVEVDLGIGDDWAINVYSTNFPIIKASGVSALFSITVPIFCIETFGRFGGRFFLAPSHDCEIYQKAIFIQRTFAP